MERLFDYQEISYNIIKINRFCSYFSGEKERGIELQLDSVSYIVYLYYNVLFNLNNYLEYFYGIFSQF